MSALLFIFGMTGLAAAAASTCAFLYAREIRALRTLLREGWKRQDLDRHLDRRSCELLCSRVSGEYVELRERIERLEAGRPYR